MTGETVLAEIVLEEDEEGDEEVIKWARWVRIFALSIGAESILFLFRRSFNIFISFVVLICHGAGLLRRASSCFS